MSEPLPACVFRGEPIDGLHPCDCASVRYQGAGVTADACRQCPIPARLAQGRQYRRRGAGLLGSIAAAATQLANYATARVKWQAAGRPEVDDDEYARRRSLCLSCPERDPDNDTCRKCGCPLHQTALGDKLRWATESCPLGKWLALAPEQQQDGGDQEKGKA